MYRRVVVLSRYKNPVAHQVNKTDDLYSNILKKGE